MDKNIGKKLSQYNSVIKENDEIYRQAAKALGLPDCAFWILYALREEDGVLTQSEICYAMYQPKQTVNSALKKMEQGGYIKLAKMNDRRSKQLCLTEKGKKLAEKTVDKAIAAEQKAFAALTLKEQESFIELFRKYTELLKTSMREISGEKQNGNTII